MTTELSFGEAEACFRWKRVLGVFRKEDGFTRGLGKVMSAGVEFSLSKGKASRFETDIDFSEETESFKLPCDVLDDAEFFKLQFDFPDEIELFKWEIDSLDETESFNADFSDELFQNICSLLVSS